ncbi:hypothetical protein [Coleofasciculus sp. E1-EBD-02]|uniref:hypothetical protein n=1 Tax=Coleofasciculus sp. E1-EBD-02 TaxID=3068481 RepID=UPI0032F5761C
MKSFKSKTIRYLVLGLLLFLVFTVHLCSPVNQVGDSRWAAHTSVSIIKEGNTNLDEYSGELARGQYAIENINGHQYTIFPIGTSLLSVPVIFPIVYLFDKNIDLLVESNFISVIFPSIRDHYEAHHEIINSEKLGILAFNPELQIFVASFFVTVTALFIYLISNFFLDSWSSLAVTFIFAFCTSSWSTASRALWQHGPSMLMLSICLYLLLVAKNKPWIIQFVGIPLAFSYVVRPTNSLSIIAISVFIFIKYRRYFLHFVAWGLTIGIPFLMYNLSIYHHILSPYYQPSRLASSPYFLEALLGNLISPSRGLFIFTPIFLFSLGGVIWLFKVKRISALDYCLLAILILHWLSISSFPHWWAGYSFGPRFFSDMIPYFMYFLVRMMQGIETIYHNINKRVIVSIFVLFTIVSLFIHYRGATHYQVNYWNAIPVSVDQFPERLWDWQDIQFMRGL